MPRFIILDGSTIREAREGEEIRPKKRQRVDEESSQPAKSERGSLLVRDPVYYFESNQPRDCVIKVENTLFKVCMRRHFPLVRLTSDFVRRFLRTFSH